MWHTVLKYKIEIAQTSHYVVCKLVAKKHDVKKHCTNTMMMVHHFVRALDFELGHFITQNIFCICPFDWSQPPGKASQTKHICAVQKKFK